MPTVLITHDKELLSCSRHNIMVTWPNLGTASSLSGLFDLALGILALLGIFKIRTMTGQNLNKIKWDFVLPLNLKEYKLFYVIIMGLVLNFVVLSQTSKKGHFLVTLCLYFKTSPCAKPFIWKWVWFTWKWTEEYLEIFKNLNLPLKLFSTYLFQYLFLLKEKNRTTVISATSSHPECSVTLNAECYTNVESH